MPFATVFWPETPNRYASTVEVLFECADGHVLGFDLVIVPRRETWAACLTAEGRLLRMALVGQC